MKKIIFIMMFFLGSGLAVAAKMEQDFQIVPRAHYYSSQLSLSAGGSANYTGSGYGAETVLKFGNDYYGISVLAGYSTLKMENTANTSIQNESYAGSIWNIGGRFYGANLFLGAGLIYSVFKDQYIGTTNTEINYTALGVRLETGIDLHLGKTLIISPKISYDITEATPRPPVTSVQKMNTFGMSLGIGLEF